MLVVNETRFLQMFECFWEKKKGKNRMKSEGNEWEKRMTKKISHFYNKYIWYGVPLSFAAIFSSSLLYSPHHLPHLIVSYFFFLFACTVHSPNHNVFHRHYHHGIVLVEFIVPCNVDLFVSEWDKVWAMRPVLPRISTACKIELKFQTSRFNEKWNM